MKVREQAILLVEDNDDDAELIAMAFNRSKITNPLIRVRDGEAALDYLFERGQQQGGNGPMPAVVLLDLGLPKIGGLDVLKAVRKDRRTEHLPVIVLTSSEHDIDRVRAFDNLANSYVRKSVNKDQFVATARQLVTSLMNSLERSAAFEEKLARQSS
jgi:two-component system, response regulator